MEGETKEDKTKQVKEKEDEHMYRGLAWKVQLRQHNLLMMFDCTEMLP